MARGAMERPRITTIANSGSTGTRKRAGGDQPPVHPCAFVSGDTTVMRYAALMSSRSRVRPACPLLPLLALFPSLALLLFSLPDDRKPQRTRIAIGKYGNSPNS